MDSDTQADGGSSVVKTVVWLVVLLLIVGGFIWYGGKGTSAEKGPITVGVIAPLTGDAAVYGEPARNVYQMAVGEINAAGGVNGRQLALVVEDGKCNGKDGANAATKLIDVDKVQVIIGGVCSSETLAAVPVAAAKKVVVFSAAASSPDLTNVSPYFFRNYPSDASQGKVLAEVAYSQKNWHTVAMLQEQTDYALGIYKAFSETFEALGGKIVKEETPSNTTDFRSIIAKLKAANANAIFVDTQTAAVSERIFKQMQDAKWKTPVLVNDVTGSTPKTLETYKTLLEGGLTAEFSTDPNNPTFAKLVADYKTKYGADLPYQTYGQTEYDALYMLRDGIKAVGYNGEKIAQWSRTVKDWEGASGKVTIGANGDRVGGHTVEVIRSGKTEKFVQ